MIREVYSCSTRILTAADEVAGIEEVAIRYGVLIQTIINFLIVALCIFIVARGINKLKDRMKKEEEDCRGRGSGRTELGSASPP